MAFWSDGTGYEPKRAYRWILSIDDIEVYTIKKVSKPSFTVSESSHQYLNHTFYYPGRVEWSTVSFSLIDPINPDASEVLMEKLNEAGYEAPSSQLDLGTMSKSKSLDTLGQVSINQLDGNGRIIETWTLKNPWIKDVKFGELDYSSDDMVEIQVELRYDSASYKTFAANGPDNF
jgi:hypothetical protein